MSLKMLQQRRGSSRDRAGLYSYTLRFANAFAAAWAVVSFGHNGSGLSSRGAAMGHEPGRLRYHDRHVLAIILALVAAEEVRK